VKDIEIKRIKNGYLIDPADGMFPTELTIACKTWEEVVETIASLNPDKQES